MDPNAALKEIRAIIAESDRTGFQPGGDDADRFIELIRGLDEWLSKGGVLPRAWER